MVEPGFLLAGWELQANSQEHKMKFVLQTMAFQDAPDRTSISIDEADADGRPVQSDGVISPQAFSPHAEKIRELGNAGVLTRIDLDLAYFSEKLLNLQIILIDVTNRANDYEALALEGEYISPESLQKSLEFDFLSVVFDSEVRELDNFMSSVQMDIVEAREKISVCENLEEFFLELAGKLEDSDEYLKQLQDQVSKMRIQSAKFQSITDCCRQEYWHHEVQGVVENSLFSLGNAKLTMQTSEQQRHILRMLEKSLARELELENNLSESISNEEELLLKLNYMEREREVCCTETAEISLETLFEAQNMADVLMGISKELLGQLHIANFSLNSSTRQKDEMRSKVGLLEKQLQDMNIQSERARSSVKASQEKQNSLQVKIHELESVIDNLEEKLSKVENKYVSAEMTCKLLADTNLELNEEIALLRSSSNTGQIDLLEKQLKQSDTQLQHAKAMIEANQEQQTMLYSAVSDMGNLIEDLKTKVSKAESRADSAEARCVLLTETNLEHSEEMSFLRGRIECLEASLRQADDAKVATANAIDMRAKVISNLLMQLAVERERLQIQTSSLAKENDILLGKCWKAKSNSSGTASQPGNDNEKESEVSRNDPVRAQHSESCGEAMAESSAASFQVDYVKEKPESEKESDSVSHKDDLDMIDTVRTIEAGQLNLKYVIMAIVICLISWFTIYLFQQEIRSS